MFNYNLPPTAVASDVVVVLLYRYTMKMLS